MHKRNKLQTLAREVFGGVTARSGEPALAMTRHTSKGVAYGPEFTEEISDNSSRPVCRGFAHAPHAGPLDRCPGPRVHAHLDRAPGIRELSSVRAGVLARRTVIFAVSAAFERNGY
jgi:hypothetical protein